ncbi:MAG: amino acid ABC transporter permease [Candidatus Promineifilaceae bacterium]
MAAITEKPSNKFLQFNQRFNWNYFLQDNVTGSRGLMIAVALLATIAGIVVVTSVSARPATAWIVIIAWLIGLLSVVVGEVFSLNLYINDWLKKNMFNSVSNTLLSLILALLTTSVVAGIWEWGIVNATFDPAKTGVDDRSPDGATWGVIWGARKLLLTGRLSPDETWRVALNTGLIGVLWFLSVMGGRKSIQERVPMLQTVTNIGWILVPFLSWMLLVGIDSSGSFMDASVLIRGVVVMAVLLAVLWWFSVISLTPVSTAFWLLVWPVGYLVWRLIGSLDIFTPINVDDLGGMLLTVILALFVTMASFPIGILLALGRRAEVQGIPAWMMWPIVAVATGYFLTNSTPELWETSRNTLEQITALWPLIIPITAAGLQFSYKGNVVQAASVLTIEIVRGVPLITLLFMSIVMAPFFLAEGAQVRNVAAVIVGYTIFSASYMAELVRGGLQAIPKGQYEAADSLGFNALQKYRFIVLPQALRILIPPLAGAVIGTFKSSSLVSIIGVFDFVGIARAVFSNDQWLGLKTELYVFMFVTYFVISSVISWYSRRIEDRAGLGMR